MKLQLAFSILLTVVPLRLAETETKPPKSPQQVLDAFVKAELGGARLDRARRGAVAKFLIHSSNDPPYLINIVSDRFEISDVPSAKDQPKLSVYFPYFYGQIDSNLHFTASMHMQPGNGLKMEGTNQEYTLIATDGQLSNAKAPREWKIEEVPAYGFISLATAIRYVTNQRERAADPSIRKNADMSLVQLKKLK